MGEGDGSVPVHDWTMLSFLQLEVVESAGRLKGREGVGESEGDAVVLVEVVSEEVVDSARGHCCSSLLLIRVETTGEATLNPELDLARRSNEWQVEPLPLSLVTS